MLRRTLLSRQRGFAGQKPPSSSSTKKAASGSASASKPHKRNSAPSSSSSFSSSSFGTGASWESPIASQQYTETVEEHHHHHYHHHHHDDVHGNGGSSPPRGTTAVFRRETRPSRSTGTSTSGNPNSSSDQQQHLFLKFASSCCTGFLIVWLIYGAGGTKRKAELNLAKERAVAASHSQSSSEDVQWQEELDTEVLRKEAIIRDKKRRNSTTNYDAEAGREAESREAQWRASAEAENNLALDQMYRQLSSRAKEVAYESAFYDFVNRFRTSPDAVSLSMPPHNDSERWVHAVDDAVETDYLSKPSLMAASQGLRVLANGYQGRLTVRSQYIEDGNAAKWDRTHRDVNFFHTFGTYLMRCDSELNEDEREMLFLNAFGSDEWGGYKMECTINPTTSQAVVSKKYKDYSIYQFGFADLEVDRKPLRGLERLLRVSGSQNRQQPGVGGNVELVLRMKWQSSIDPTVSGKMLHVICLPCRPVF